MKKAIVTLSSVALLFGFGSTSYVEANEVSNVKQVTQSSQESGSDIPDGISLENVDQQELTQFLTGSVAK